MERERGGERDGGRGRDGEGERERGREGEKTNTVLNIFLLPNLASHFPDTERYEERDMKRNTQI
eukprot:670944-Amorphochlora_amoeboformis.AAC.1